MSLIDTLNQDIKEAMKAKEKDVLAVLRMLKASVQHATIEAKRELTSDEELTILARELKQRKESIQEFLKANRQDLVEKTQQEVSIVEKYLPEQLSENEIIEAIKKIAQQVGATGMADFGKVMGPVMAELKGKADGNTVNSLVKKVLQG
ncbi:MULTISPECIES: GatB/YqeY domain-containing protein [unclassified Granulicatella]|uniref:GatB/YqeY domain-containing protein n=1 Tax=unclassified Granulicatella TaxID=2630493 RepID=UPI001073FFE6|nr:MULTISPECIES: GatB/YqeY domain-containing protein [unclassified Granulicatella]MBF0780929.1 GatB/YqeY domain-containing protein [Granulicatella sp. 19428wC4_WM01]TFU93207.1 GatB/YqeY domain-containing protein [Granulicatella sp. WM01]